MIALPMARLRDRARQQIVTNVRALLNDSERGERPVGRSQNSLFLPGSPIWRVHGDVTTMMIGGIAALLLQMLHPLVLAGVWDHSNFRNDMIGRLRRTARFIALTTYGAHDEAEAAIDRVRRIHARISGTVAHAQSYRASDPRLLAWVHVTEAISFLGAWQAYGDRPLLGAEQDLYFEQFAQIAMALGADPVPRSCADASRLVREMRPELRATARSREVAGLVLGHHQPDSPLAVPIWAVTAQAAIDLLPPWARGMHSLSRSSPFARPIVRGGALGLAKTLRWAFIARDK
jgi:uncharacterized protein (DUF2236 family)